MLHPAPVSGRTGRKTVVEAVSRVVAVDVLRKVLVPHRICSDEVKLPEVPAAVRKGRIAHRVPECDLRIHIVEKSVHP